MGKAERQFIRLELTQRKEEGCDVSGIQPRVDAAFEQDGVDLSVFVDLYDELDSLAPDPSFPYEEPSELDAIRALRPDGPRRMTVTASAQTLRDRIYGGWLGRAAGCSLGKPVEGWQRKRIDDYLAETNALPLNDYIPFSEGAINQYLKSSTRGNIEFMARDDDMDYPILGLIALERKGSELTPRDMANTWLNYMPFNLLYTAENVAYRNFVNRLWPPESASWRNPFREWIGAQIRADIFGYVTPGWPEKAAELAYQDASISHVKNGIYGEMFIAAMIAASFVTDDIEEIIDVGLSEIPANCRLTEAVQNTRVWCKETDDWEQVWDHIFEHYGHYSGVHTINNAALVVMGLMFGKTNYEQGIVLTVRGGWDTDCNGATVGSILGSKMGAEELPDKWIGVLSNRLKSVVRDFNDNRISDLAERTYEMAMRLANETEVAEASGDAEAASVDEGDSFVGTWDLDFQHDDCVLVLREDGSGILRSENADQTTAVENLKVAGTGLKFTLFMNKGEMDVPIDFAGKVAGDRLEGLCESNGFEFQLKGVRR